MSVHAEEAIGDDQSSWCVGGLGELVFELIEACVVIDVQSGAAESAAIDQAGVVESVGKDGIAVGNESRDGTEIRGES